MILDLHLAQQVCPSDNFVNRRDAEFSQNFADFSRHRRKIVYQHFRLSVEARAKLFVLRRDADRARVEMALANIPAADRNKGCCSEIVFFRSKHCRDHDVASGFHPPIRPQRHTAAQSIQHKHLLCFRDTKLPAASAIFHRA